MDVREEQPEKQLFPKYVTGDGIETYFREVQPKKQLFPILSTEDGMEMDVSEEQFSKQHLSKLFTLYVTPLYSTLLGITISFSVPIYERIIAVFASVSMLYTKPSSLIPCPSSPCVGMITLKLSQGDVVLYDSNEASGTKRNACSIGLGKKKEPFCAVGILHVTVLIEEQFSKHMYPKLCTDDGIEIDAREVHPEKLYSPTLVTEEGIEIDVREEQPAKQ